MNAKVINTKGQTLKAGGVVVLRPEQEQAQILLINRSRHGDCQFPKGHVDQGETAEQAALREIKEETGVGVRVIKLLPDLEYITGKGESVLCKMFLMVPDMEILNTTDADEMPEWVEIDQVVIKLTNKNLKEYFASIISLIIL